jgi:hypothetical protein
MAATDRILQGGFGVGGVVLGLLTVRLDPEVVATLTVRVVATA